MELRQLRYFIAVAENGNFSRAAKRLHLTQPALSRQVRGLEEELGLHLIKRGKYAASLTSVGEVFLREARTVLAQAEQAVQTTLQAAGKSHGKLTVGLCGPAVATLLPTLIREFRVKHPGIILTIKDLEPARQPAALIAGIVDIGFTRRVPEELNDQLESELYFEEPLVAALPSCHVLASKRAVQLRQLAQERFILYCREGAPELFETVSSYCRTAGFAPRIVASPNHWQSILTLVEAGEGVTLVPSSVQNLRSNGVIFRPLTDRSCHSNVVLAWRRGRADTIRDSFLEKLRRNRPSSDLGLPTPRGQASSYGSQ